MSDNSLNNVKIEMAKKVLEFLKFCSLFMLVLWAIGIKPFSDLSLCWITAPIWLPILLLASIWLSMSALALILKFILNKL